MTAVEKQKLKALFVAMAMYYAQDIPDPALQLYVEDLEDLPFDDVVRALSEIRRDPQNRRIPLPATIRAKLVPSRDDTSIAREVAARIYSAISAHGWANPDRAREYIGALGWEVVKLQGGWLSVCETVNDYNATTFQAQWRGLAETVMQKQRAGNLDVPPALPPGPTSSVSHNAEVKRMIDHVATTQTMCSKSEG